jgi:TetR/AcrR family transcriptional regulator, regulator of autoinduction and epiphytic fitness
VSIQTKIEKMAKPPILENGVSNLTDKIDKADQILQGAMQEFLVNGYAATSMDRVAATAGVSKATVYSHFRDKEGLFTALIQRLAQRKFSAIYGSQPFDGEPAVVLRQLATNALATCCDAEYLAFIRLIFGESGRFPELAQLFIRYLTKPGIETLTAYLSSCPELGLKDPEAAARILIGSSVYYVMTQELLHGKEIIPMEHDRLVDTLMDLLLRSQT